MNTKEIINWLLEGDVSIQFQAQRDLLGEEQPTLQKRISQEGWGNAISESSFVKWALGNEILSTKMDFYPLYFIRS